MGKHRFQWDVRPLALKENMVTGDKYRFTVLTPSLLRLEYDPEGHFEDRASQVTFYRDFPKNDYSVTIEQEILTLNTGNLTLTYRENDAFTPDSLSIHLNVEPASTWRFGETFEDLGGTTRTLDTVNGEMPLGRGVCSRNGFSVIDDSRSLALDENGWIALRGTDLYDVYFFGYGFDYQGAVRDLYRLTGAPSMLPAYALGNWWSRYHKYTQQEYIDLMERFMKEGVPFSVGVIDMDWHIVDIPEAVRDPQSPGGWTGYSWNKELFPDYKAFLQYLHEHHISTTLNLHPADCVRKHEDMYEEMARACGIDPATGERVRLDVVSDEFMEHYFNILHHPYEQDGVDFWWMDWQQGTDYHWAHEPNRDGHYHNELERVDPLWQLNHLHILDIGRDGKRPMFFSRYSGVGSHRYPVGFSGDTFCTWESLAFQPYFTASASNIGYSWWSHDIGGHMSGYRNADLLVRWMQFGLFSPINRIHSSNNPYQQKEPWYYDMETEKVMKDVLRMRHNLFPYLYTMNYRNHMQLIPLITPMYYHYPKCDHAYEVKNQYFFGSELMVAPITQERNRVSHLAKARVWLPEGDWFDFFDGTRYDGCGGRMMNVYRSIDRYPVFAKAGAIVPMANFKDNELKNNEELTVLFFPGASNDFVLYEDGLDGNEYQNGAFATTHISTKWGSSPVFTIHPAAGMRSLIPGKRVWNIALRGFTKNAVVSVSIDAVARSVETSYDRMTHTVMLRVEAATDELVQVTVSGEDIVYCNEDYQERIRDITVKCDLSLHEKNEIYKEAMRTDLSSHARIYHMSGQLPDHQAVVDAVAEQLTLTVPEFPQDWQISF